MTFTPEIYSLAEKNRELTSIKYDRWIGECARKKKIQETYSFTYNQLYRRFQTSITPVNIYHKDCLILLLRAFTT